MKKIKLTVYVVGIVGLSVIVQTHNLLFASSCCPGGGGAKHRSSAEEYQSKERKELPPIEITEVKLPPEMTVKGILTCPGGFLAGNIKSYCHDDRKCKNTAIIVEKVVECDKSGKEDCPYEGKLYHILFNENSKRLVNNKKYQNAGVSINGRFYTDERVLEVVSFRLLNEEEIKEMESQQEKQSSEEETIYPAFPK